MATRRKIEANRRNWAKRRGLTAAGRERIRRACLRNQPWRKSTGPRTPEGKARSRGNAVFFGDRARQIEPFASAYALCRAIRVAKRESLARLAGSRKSIRASRPGPADELAKALLGYASATRVRLPRMRIAHAGGLLAILTGIQPPISDCPGVLSWVMVLRVALEATTAIQMHALVRHQHAEPYKESHNVPSRESGGSTSFGGASAG